MSLALEYGTQWYRGQCDLGGTTAEVDVGVVIGEAGLANLNGPLKVIRQAALLAEVELTLQAIEIWQRIDLDLRPVDSSEDCVEVVISPSTLNHYYPVKLRLPADSLQKLQPVTDELTRSLTLSWSDCTASLVLDTLIISDQEYRKLEHGAVVLLPGSFQSTWVSELVVPELGAQRIQGQLCLHTDQFVISGQLADDQIVTNPDKSLSRSSFQLSIRLQQNVSVPTDLLLGEIAGNSLDLSLNTTEFSAELVHESSVIATGNLGPVGVGYALYIDKMVNNMPQDSA